MNGLTIFNHSARQVTGNLGMAIRVSWWFVAIILVAVIVAFLLIPEDVLSALDQTPEEIADNLSISGGSALLLILAAIAAAVFIFWAASLIAIVWHRYILLEEMPIGTIPYRKEFRIGRYFWYGVGVTLLTLIVGMVIGGFLLMILGPGAMSSLEANQLGGGLALGIIGALITGIIVTVFYLRMALILPAVALEEGLTIGKAWEASKGYSGAIAGAAVMLTILNIVVGFIFEFLLAFGLPELLVSVFDLAFNWFYFMLNISILSTLYGHIVQKREIY